MTAPQNRADVVRVMAHAMRRRPATVEQKAEAALAFLEAAGLRVVPVEATAQAKKAYTDRYGCPAYGCGHEYRKLVAASPFAPDAEP